MYPLHVRRAVLARLESGESQNSVSKATGIARATLQGWLRQHIPRSLAYSRTSCVRCCGERWQLTDVAAPYSYLLGLYLGDGCLSLAPRDVWVLRIACDATWQGVLDECRRAIERVMPHNRVSVVADEGCRVVQCCSKHWPCLFPQHGPGKKHERAIVLEPWQAEVVHANPRPFLRGLIHSDGCRITNWTVRTVDGQPKRYEYPRYFFSNRSTDILGLYTDALDLLGIVWRYSRPDTVSVARKEAVVTMDEFIGPKY